MILRLGRTYARAQQGGEDPRIHRRGRDTIAALVAGHQRYPANGVCDKPPARSLRHSRRVGRLRDPRLA